MKRGTGRRLARKVPLLLVMATIFFLSHQPGHSLQLPPLPGIDKLAHVAIYGLLAMATFFAFAPSAPSGRPRTIAFGVVAFCLLFGLSDEYHQSFVAGRWASGWDLLADFLGALAISWLWLRRRAAGAVPS